MGINIITANFTHSGRDSITRKLYQYDYGQKVSIRGLSLPNTFEVHISNQDDINTAEVYTGRKNEIDIPDKFLLSGQNIYMWLFLHAAAADGQTRYTIMIPVEERPKPQPAVPTVDNNVINDLLINALQNGLDGQPRNSAGINVTTAKFNGERDSITRKLYQYDYGQIISIKGLNLPKVFEVHISNSNKASTAEIYIGKDNEIEIPDKFLLSGEDIYLWIFLHSTAEDGETRYTITVPVKKKPKPEGQEPTVVERNAIDELIAALEINLNEMRQATEDAKNAMNEATAAAKEQMQLVIDKANDVVSKYPKIIEDYWYIYDVENQVWVNTQIKALAVDGVGIENIVYNNDYTITINLTDGTSYTTESIRGQKGEKGDTGATPNIKIQSTETLAPNQYANVTISGTPEEPKLTFRIPKGEKGDKGDTGAMPQISIGTVETLLPHRAGYVTQTGTTENPVLNFGLVKGETGEQGPQGQKGDTGETGPQGIQGQIGPKGEKGQQGIQGETGPKGDKGDTGERGQTGKTAYEYAVDGGYTGSENDFSEKLADIITTQDVNQAIADALADVTGIEYHVCAAAEYNASTFVPTLSGKTGIIYLVPKNNSETSNIYYEYIYTGSAFEKIGDTSVDLSNYLKTTDISAWAKAANKPNYTASEVGALPNDTFIPTKTSDLTNDSGYLTEHQDISGKANITDLATVATSGNYNDLSNKPTIPTKVSDLTDDSGHYTKPSGGIPASDLADGVVPVEDVQVNGVSVLNNGVANVPIATASKPGVVLVSGYGLQMQSDGNISTKTATSTEIKAGSRSWEHISPNNQHESTFYGLAKAAGDTTQSSSNNAVGNYTDSAKTAIQNMLGISDGYVTKESIDNAGITNRTYAPLFGGQFSVTTATTENYINPYARAAVTGRISKHYTYRVIVNETQYILPCRLWYLTLNNGSIKAFEYIGNLNLYISDISGVPGKIDNVPFIIISDLNDSNSIDVLTSLEGTYNILVERIDNIQTELPKSLIYGDAYEPVLKKNRSTSTYNGYSLGVNELLSARGTFAFGYGNKISNDFAMAFGLGNTVSGHAGMALGENNTVSGGGSFVEGSQNIASGVYAHSEGYQTKANGHITHAEGYQTEAKGSFSHAEGFNTIADGLYSHVEGYQTTASGTSSNAIGISTIANSSGMHAQGIYNKEDNIIFPKWVKNTSYVIDDCVTYGEFGYKCIVANSDETFNTEHWKCLFRNGAIAFIIGNGTDDLARSNAYKVDWNGNGYYNGDVYVNCAADSTGGAKLISEIDYASTTKAGLVRVNGNGVQMVGDRITLIPSTNEQIKAGTAFYAPLGPGNQHRAVFYGLAKAAGDTTQSSSNNAVGAYTDEAKAAIQQMLGIGSISINVITISETSPTIIGEANTRYNCGEVISLNLTPPSVGTMDIRFTSGSTVTTLTVPNTIKFPEWFDPSSLEINTIYEICITDGIYAGVTSWTL